MTELRHPDRVRPINRRGFTLVELLVVIAIIGILVALLLPAVQAARESARRTQCQNNMKQLVTAMHVYHDAYNRFPPGHTGWGTTTQTNYQHSWMTLILPFVEEQALYDQYDFNLVWNQGTNARNVTRARAGNLSVQLCPSSEHVDLAQGDYAGINGCGSYNHDGVAIRDGYLSGECYNAGFLPATGPMFPENSAVGIQHCTDGTNYTMMLGEDAGRVDANRFWGDAHQTFGHHAATINTKTDPPEAARSNELFSDHPSGLYIGLGGGNVRFLNENVSERVIDFITTKAQGEVVVESF
jgi:prepilin-type N-terminal cleavage/methylation domain-containing protein